MGRTGQRFNSAGVAQGSEFRVNATVAQDQQFASVAMNANGDFVVAWTTDTAGDAGVRAQRFNAAVPRKAGEIQVNVNTLDDQQWQSIAMDNAGNFVITWTSANQDGSGYGVYAQRFNASGVGQGEFSVNTATANDQMHSQVAMDAAGNFVIVWERIYKTALGLAFMVSATIRRVAQGGEFLVNTTTAGDQMRSTVAMDAAGNFVVSWTSSGQDGSGTGIYARAIIPLATRSRAKCW